MELLNGEDASQSNLERQGAGRDQDQPDRTLHGTEADSNHEPRLARGQVYKRMNPRKLVLTLAIAVLLAACQTKDRDLIPGEGASSGSQDSQEGVVQLEPQLPTGVHLQAAFELPDTLEGMPTTHAELRYLVYLPEGYDEDPDRDWPLIFFLHGSGDEDYDSTFVLSFGLPAVLLAGEQPEDFPFVVISPQAFPGEVWWSPEMLAALGALLDEVSQTYRVDTDRVYLTGLSMGATARGGWRRPIQSVLQPWSRSPGAGIERRLCRSRRPSAAWRRCPSGPSMERWIGFRRPGPLK